MPDLGFNERMERVFDYGARSFTVSITPELEIQVRDQEGRKLKNMPAPGKRDEEDKAARAYEEFKAMKKQLKTVSTCQKRGWSWPCHPDVCGRRRTGWSCLRKSR